VRNQLRLQDFGEHALSRANGMSPIVDHQSTVNRSSCGRRTSLAPSADLKNPSAPALPISIASFVII